MKLRLDVVIGISLLLTVCLVIGSYLAIYHHSYEIDMDELEVVSKEYKNGVLTVRVSCDMKGEFLYRVKGSENADGDYELTFFGGKQPDLAQTPGKAQAVFTIEIPAGYTKIVCGKTTFHTISS